jgi:hypothetical protein
MHEIAIMSDSVTVTMTVTEPEACMRSSSCLYSYFTLLPGDTVTEAIIISYETIVIIVHISEAYITYSYVTLLIIVHISIYYIFLCNLANHTTHKHILHFLM